MARVKSPVELVAGVVRLTGEFDRPRYEILERYSQASYMGQILNNPPSVEGWHTGTDWLNSGTLVERINFASQQVGDVSKPGVRAMVERISAQISAATSPERLVDACLEEVWGAGGAGRHPAGAGGFLVPEAGGPGRPAGT